MWCCLVWVEQINKGKPFKKVSGDKLERHLCKGNMHLCCHVCRLACKSLDYVESFGRNNLVVDCMSVCKEFECR